MKQRFWLFKRGRSFYLQDSETGKQISLKTRERRVAEEAQRARNNPHFRAKEHLLIAQAHILSADPAAAERTWGIVMDRMASQGKPSTRHRVQRQMRGFGWLFRPLIAPKLWPKHKAKPKRAITWEEHQKVLDAEYNLEWQCYLETLWEIGAAQTDAANLNSADIDSKEKILAYCRRKTEEWAHIRIGKRLESILKKLPSSGLLFPNIAKFNDSRRAWHFSRVCKRADVVGVTLHSYRYAWAERAKSAGYPERWAQAALGHNSRAVHQTYAKNAKVICPSLEEYQRKTVTLRK